MRLLMTGDFHLDAITAGHARHDEVRSAFGQVIERVRDQRIDAVLFLGDLCNPDRGSRTLRAVTAGIEMFQDLVRRTGCTVIAIAGNHDVVSDTTGLTSLSPLRAAFGGKWIDRPALDPPSGKEGPVPAIQIPPGVTAIAEQPTLLELTGEGTPVHVLALPFVSSVNPYDPPTVVQDVTGWRNAQGHGCPLIVAGHLSIEGATLGSETSDMARGRDVQFPRHACGTRNANVTLMCNGHYHKRQTVNGIECPGSLARLAFGEESNEPRWLEVEL
jgi:DNA repair exonuclease SbcCD nuclease subunit